jgi:hypothetical protein
MYNVCHGAVIQSVWLSRAVWHLRCFSCHLHIYKGTNTERERYSKLETYYIYIYVRGSYEKSVFVHAKLSDNYRTGRSQRAPLSLPEVRRYGLQ